MVSSDYPFPIGPLSHTKCGLKVGAALDVPRTGTSKKSIVNYLIVPRLNLPEFIEAANGLGLGRNRVISERGLRTGILAARLVANVIKAGVESYAFLSK
jgi:hypothetical protein